EMKLSNNIETPRLILRSYLDADKDFCISLWCDAENGEFMADPLFENADEKYLSFFDGMEDDPDGYYLVAELKTTGEPVGTFCMFPEKSNYDIGYCIKKDNWREGLGSEMLSSAIERIKALGGTSVTCEIADANAASRALAQKFGFAETKKTQYKKRNTGICFDAHIFELRLDSNYDLRT
ncbi:MAG: GNAT family N-acetyltransferase, partial [Clostridia bacterium]|nr:GNAT family N-acetyltransferase [Clostridia bacterium]